MKTDGLGRACFFSPVLQLHIVPPRSLKCLHLPGINIKHHDRGEPSRLVKAQAVDQCLVEMVTNEGVGGLRHALANAKKFTHASCL